MVIFRSWLEKTLPNHYSLLKVEVDGIAYSIPCEPTLNIYNVENNTFTLKNPITKTQMSWRESEVKNVEVFSLGDLNGSKLMMDQYVSSRIHPMMSAKLLNISNTELGNLIFIDGMDVNFLKIMDFMKFSSPTEFCKVNLSGNDSKIIRNNFSKIILNRMDFTISNMVNLMGEENSRSICSDIRRNVEDFLISIETIPVERLKDHWPSLLNPSPLYFLPKKIYNDG